MNVDPHKKRLRILRYICYVLVLIPLIHFSVKYDIDEIPDGYEKLTPQKMPPGTKVVLTDCDEDTVIGLGSVVLYKPPGLDTDKLLFGVVVALPGEDVKFETFDNRIATLTFGDRREELPLPATLRLLPGVIPPDHYVLLNGDRLLGSDLKHPDSRALGPIPRSAFKKKVVVPLTFL